MNTLPTEPLRRLIELMTGPERSALAVDIGYADVPWKNSGLRRALARTSVSVFLADRIAVRLGYHPADLYGSAWWDVGKDENGGECSPAAQTETTAGV